MFLDQIDLRQHVMAGAKTGLALCHMKSVQPKLLNSIGLFWELVTKRYLSSIGEFIFTISNLISVSHQCGSRNFWQP
jgi:hypothetical protein